MAPIRPNKATKPVHQLRRLLTNAEHDETFTGSEQTDEEAIATIEKFLAIVREKKRAENEAKQQNEAQKKLIIETEVKASVDKYLKEMFNASSSSSENSIIDPEPMPEQNSEEDAEGGAVMKPIDH